MISLGFEALQPVCLQAAVVMVPQCLQVTEAAVQQIPRQQGILGGSNLQMRSQAGSSSRGSP